MKRLSTKVLSLFAFKPHTLMEVIKMSLFDKFKRKAKEPTNEELLKEELIAEMRNEIDALSKLDRDDVFDVQVRLEHLERLESEVKILNSIKTEDFKKVEAKTEIKKGIIPSIIGAGATILSAIALMIFEKEECITGSSAKEFLRKIFGGFKKN